MRVISHVLKNIREAVVFGPTFCLRHVGRLMGRPVIRTWIRGLGHVYIRPADSDAATFHQILIDRPYDMKRFPQHTRAEAAYRRILALGNKPVVIDAGANVGAASLWFAKTYPDAIVVSVEPDSDTARVCRMNVEKTQNIVFVEAAIGQCSGQVTITRASKSWETQTVRSDDGGTAVVSVPDLLAQMGPKAELFIVKVDIEGFEDDLFGGHLEWLAMAPIVMIEPHDWLFPGRRTSRSFMRALSDTEHELLIADDTLVFVL